MSSDPIEPLPELSGSSEGNPREHRPPDVTQSSGNPPPTSSSFSGDELSVILTLARPDPLLGEYRSTEDMKPEPARVNALEALANLDLSEADRVRVQPSNRPTLDSSQKSPDPDFESASPISIHPERSAKTRRSRSKDPEAEVSDDRGIPLSTLLLASYASAVTLGLLWVLWTGRRVRDFVAEPEPPPSSGAEQDPGLRADRARRITPPPPIAAEHLTSLGRAVRIGMIEVTPLRITSGPVELGRVFNSRQTKPGGKNTLKLLLSLKNISSELILAPLDEAFLRSRPRFDMESYIETSQDGGTISLYPLALESEWSIVGQDFREIRPAETFETLVVSAPDALGRITPEMTWRIRLRTDINHTDDLGVRFHATDVQAESGLSGGKPTGK